MGGRPFCPTSLPSFPSLPMPLSLLRRSSALPPEAKFVEVRAQRLQVGALEEADGGNRVAHGCRNA